MIVALDGSNFFFISYGAFVSKLKEKNGDDYVIKEDDLGLFYHMFLRKIMKYITTYENCIFCFEGKHSTKWRKETYPLYKENRADRKNDPNYKYVPILMEKVIEFCKLFHTKVLTVENCEGDDCIYQACKYYAEQGEKVKIVSTDRDLTQIMNFYPELVTQTRPEIFGRPEEELIADENIILKKCIIGDTADNIKGIPRIGEKIFEKMLADKSFWNKKMTPENIELMETIEKIVDLRKYPEEFQNNIIEEVKKDWNNFDKDGVEKFMLDNGLKSCYSDWSSDWCPAIESMLSDNYEKPDAIDEIMEIING